MKKVFCIIKEETSSEYIYVEANSKKEAIEIAEGCESEAWHQNQDYSAEITSAEVEKDRKNLIGRIIETKRGSYSFKKENI